MMNNLVLRNLIMYMNKDQFHERYSLPKLTQDETENLNRLISIKEIESLMNTAENTRP